MNKDYDRKKHHRLLKYSENLRKQGKSIGTESREDYLELLNYSAIVYSQLNWKIKDEYLEIFKKFLKNKISSSQFCELLEEKLELTEELSNNTLESDYIHEKASKFTDFLDDLSIACEVCDRSPEPYILPGHIGETEFRKEVEENFSELQKFIEE